MAMENATLRGETVKVRRQSRSPVCAKTGSQVIHCDEQDVRPRVPLRFPGIGSGGTACIATHGMPDISQHVVRERGKCPRCCYCPDEFAPRRQPRCARTWPIQRRRDLLSPRVAAYRIGHSCAFLWGAVQASLRAHSKNERRHDFFDINSRLVSRHLPRIGYTGKYNWLTTQSEVRRHEPKAHSSSEQAMPGP